MVASSPAQIKLDIEAFTLQTKDHRSGDKTEKAAWRLLAGQQTPILTVPPIRSSKPELPSVGSTC